MSARLASRPVRTFITKSGSTASWSTRCASACHAAMSSKARSWRPSRPNGTRSPPRSALPTSRLRPPMSPPHPRGTSRKQPADVAASAKSTARTLPLREGRNAQRFGEAPLTHSPPPEIGGAPLAGSCLSPRPARLPEEHRRHHEQEDEDSVDQHLVDLNARARLPPQKNRD